MGMIVKMISKTSKQNQWVRSVGVVFCSLALFVAVVVGCAREQLPPAPYGDRSVLEKLADSFRHETDKMTISPRNQPPRERRLFVERVFSGAGYGYVATLEGLASGELDSTEQLHRDLVELVFFPTVGISGADLGNFYSDDEVAAIQKIKAAMR